MELKTLYVPVVQEKQPQQYYPNRYPPIQHEMQPQQYYPNRYPPIQHEMQPQQHYPNSYPPIQHEMQPQQHYPNRYPLINQYEMQPLQDYPNRCPPIRRETHPQDYSRRYSWYMPCALLACVCCLWPCGIPAIVYSDKASVAARNGDLETAERSASKAEICVTLSVVFGTIILIIVVICFPYINGTNPPSYDYI